MHIMASSRWSGIFRSLHFPLLWLIVLSLMLNWGAGYRTLLYINFFAVLAYVFFNLRQLTAAMSPLSWGLLVVPVTFTLLHWVAVGQFEIIKEVRQMWLAVFLAISLWLFGVTRVRLDNRSLFQAMVLLLIVYCVAQVIALEWFDRPYGTHKNPHYLAFYSSIALILVAYLFNRIHLWWRTALVISSPILGYMLLVSSSRPAWLAMMLVAVLGVLIIDHRWRWARFATIAGVCGLLFYTNYMNFGVRMTELAENIPQEERVKIWQDTWRMQEVSPLSAWIWGHGLDSFQETFKAYSHYRGIMDFNSPHNTFLDVLYVSGVIGVLELLIFYAILYRQLSAMHAQVSIRQSARYLILLLTFNFVFILITMPTFSSYNLYILGFVTGLMLLLKQQHRPSS